MREEPAKEELEDFYYDLCALVEDHADGDVEKSVQFIRSLDKFRESWLSTYSVTGLLWRMEDDNQ